MRARSNPLHGLCQGQKCASLGHRLMLSSRRGAQACAKGVWTRWVQGREGAHPSCCTSSLPLTSGKPDFMGAKCCREETQLCGTQHEAPSCDTVQAHTTYYLLLHTEVSCIFNAFFFSSGKELSRVEQDLYDSHMYDSCTSEIFNLCYATTMHMLYLELYST